MDWKMMDVSDAYSVVADQLGLKPKDVKAAVEGIMTLATEQMKKSGKFNLAAFLMLKLKVRPATKARKGVNLFTKEPCVFKAKPSSKTAGAIPMKKPEHRRWRRLIQQKPFPKKPSVFVIEDSIEDCETVPASLSDFSRLPTIRMLGYPT